MGKRSKQAQRCATCRQHEAKCICAHLPRLKLNTRLVLVMHHRELPRPTATGPLAVAALEGSELHLHGVRDAPLDLRHLHHEGRRVMVLFPSEGAVPLTRELVASDPRPITLVVPDGNWRQATRMPRRIPGLPEAQAVTLPPGPATRWGVRREHKVGGLATFEAIARAFGILESDAVQETLDAFFDRMLHASSVPSAGASAPPVESMQVTVSILHQDEHLLVINKPSGMPVHHGWARDGVTAVEVLREKLGARVFPVHRLDRATSGALVFALTSEVARDLQTQFTNGSIEKRYLALCRGNDPELSRIDRALKKEGFEKAQSAVTELSLRESFGRYGLYDIIPRTGRTHQIRRHLKHASHPIVGDVRYGKGEHNRFFRQHYNFDRLALHCQSMAFVHPRSGDALRIDAPLSTDFRWLIERLTAESTATTVEPPEVAP